MGIMITHHGYDNGHNPVYNAHKNVGEHYPWQNTFCVDTGCSYCCRSSVTVGNAKGRAKEKFT